MSRPEDVDRLARRIDRLYLSHSPDALLQLVHLLAEVGLSLPLGLLVQGTVVHGTVVGVGAFAERTDQAYGDVATHHGKTLNPTDPVGTYARSLAETLQQGRQARTRYDANATLDDFDVEDAWPILTTTAPASYLHLANVRVYAPVVREVAVMRVRTEHISAWWPLAGEAGVAVAYQDPVADDE